MVRLLAKPENYVGKKIRVVGVLFRDIEVSHLFISRDSLEGFDTVSAIELPSEPTAWPASQEEIDSLNERIVAVEGVVEIVPNRLHIILKMKNVTRIFGKGGFGKAAHTKSTELVNPR